MDHCRQCNSTLKSDEKECWGCGAGVPEQNSRPSFNERFRKVVKVTFLMFAGLTVASLFVESLSFVKCISGLLVLFLVKNSADYMAEAKKG